MMDPGTFCGGQLLHHQHGCRNLVSLHDVRHCPQAYPLTLQFAHRLHYSVESALVVR